MRSILGWPTEKDGSQRRRQPAEVTLRPGNLTATWTGRLGECAHRVRIHARSLAVVH